MCDNWPTITVTDMNITDYGMKCCNKWRSFVNCKSGLLQKLLFFFNFSNLFPVNGKRRGHVQILLHKIISLNVTDRKIREL
jgi:hypothetical protein